MPGSDMTCTPSICTRYHRTHIHLIMLILIDVDLTDVPHKWAGFHQTMLDGHNL